MGGIIGTSIRAIWSASKTVLITSTIVGLIVLNIMTLVSDKVYDGLYGVMDNLVPGQWVSNSKHNKTKQLQAKHDQLQKKWEGHKAKAKNIRKSVARRTLKNTTVNLSAIPAESIPWLGAGMALAVTVMDLKDACDNMNDIDGLMLDLGLNGSEETEKICGMSKKPISSSYSKFKYELGESLGHAREMYKGKWESFQNSLGGTLDQIFNK